MTDELTIQGVNPQMQQVQKKNNTVPYTLGGAAVGAAAGWGATALYKESGSAKSFDDLVKDANEKDKLELTSKKAAVDDAEKKLAEAGKAVYEGNEKLELEDAIKARDAELTKLTKGETKVISKGGEILPYDSNWSMTDKQRNDYQRLYTDYTNAKANFESSTTYKDLNDAIKRRELAVTDMYDNIMQDVKDKVKPKSTRRKDIKSLEEYLNSSVGKGKIEDELIANKIVRLTDNEIINLAGGKDKLVDTKPAFSIGGYKHIPVVQKDGTVKYAKVQVSKTFGKTEYEKLMQKHTDELAEKVSNSMTSYIENIKKVNELPETISKELDKGLLKNLGIQRTDIDKAFLDDLKINMPTFEADAKTIKDAKLIRTGTSYSYSAAVQDVLTRCGVDTPEEAKKILDSKIGIGRKYIDKEKALLNDIDNIINNDKTLNVLNDRMAKLKKSDKTLNNLESQIKGQFKKYLGGEKTTVTKPLTQEEAMKKDSYKRLAKIVEDKQAIYDKIAAEKGKVNETAKKTAQEAVEKAKGELDKLVADLNGKVKGMSGTAKALVIGGVAAAGALIGLSMSNKSKNV